MIKPKTNGGISISPKETINTVGKNFIKTKEVHKAILNQRIQKKYIHKVDNIKAPKTKR